MLTLLLRRQDPSGATNADADADAQLELALLRLWAAPDASVAALAALDAKRWRRLALQLFAADVSLVRAVVAVLERVASSSRSEAAARRVLRQLWQSPGRALVQDKVVNWLEQGRLGTHEEEDEQQEIASRLLRVLAASLSAAIATKPNELLTHEDDPFPEATGADALEIVGLLLTLLMAVERAPTVAQVAAMELRGLLSEQQQPPGLQALLTTHICSSTALRHCVDWLLAQDEAPCFPVYIELLAATASGPCEGGGDKGNVFNDTAAMLQICTVGLAAADPSTQHASLRLLCALLAHSDASASALCSAMRLSGVLISISWLLGHAVAHIAAAAATALELVTRQSPSSDTLRVIIEQGCVLIYWALLTASSEAKRTPTQADVAANCLNLLNWATQEVARQTSVVAAAVQSVLSSANVLLQKNIILTLQILAQRSDAVREALEEQEFRSDALVLAIQADEDAGLAMAVLSAGLSCCDKCSTLKIEGCVKDEEDSALADQSLTIRIRCADGEYVEANAALLLEHSNLLRGWSRNTTDLSQDQEGEAVATSIVKLHRFRLSIVQLFVELLPKAQHVAVRDLTELQSLSTLLKLLRLGNATDSIKCWHATTAAICRAMTRSNWLEIFQFASTEVRHPTLVLRCVRFALQLRRQEDAHGPARPQPRPEEQLQSESTQKERVELTAALKQAAIQLGQELLTG
ncbi:hypothetical protein BBJ28_00018078 [Nothophytophthora sp. Chile5]|nr:hypothetical protein BBJ28_00018078 [Nothophytophthora sp. Chile5]